MLWAEITGRANIVKYCRLLIAMEQHAARVYWHLYPESDGEARDQPYPEPEVRSLVTIGMCNALSQVGNCTVLTRYDQVMCKIGRLVHGCECSTCIPSANTATNHLFRFWGNQKVQIAAIQILPVRLFIG